MVRVLFGSPRRAEPRSRRQDSAVERPIPSVSRTAMVTPAGLRLVPTLTTIETASPDGTPSGTTTFNSIIWREEKLLHVTDPLSQIGISVQSCWTGCSKTNDYQCGQQRILIRVLPERALPERHWYLPYRFRQYMHLGSSWLIKASASRDFQVDCRNCHRIGAKTYFSSDYLSLELNVLAAFPISPELPLLQQKRRHAGVY